MGASLPWSGLNQPLSLNSFHFLLLAAAAIILLRSFLRGPLRGLVLLGLNGYFFYHFLSGWQALAVFLGLVGFAYVLGRSGLLRERLPRHAPTVGVILLWVFLFLVKDPNLLPWLNPFASHPIMLIGVSYMVFRCIQFIMDAEVVEEADLLSFVNFVFFFPTLLAGPIDQYEPFQLFHKGEGLLLNESPLPALHRLANGYLKKFVIYENLVAWSYFAPTPGEDWPVPLLWLGVLLLPVLLYLDFSGYCDVMIGLGRLMGYRLPENFNKPWKAANIQEFWNRWHMTLSMFIRNYVFNPLSYCVYSGCSRRWQFPLLLALSFVTMILLGLWHATTVGFLLFGIAHGLVLVLVQVAHQYVYPRLPEALNRFRQGSRMVFVCCWSGNYLFLALTMVLWTQGASGFLRVAHQLFGG